MLKNFIITNTNDVAIIKQLSCPFVKECGILEMELKANSADKGESMYASETPNEFGCYNKKHVHCNHYKILKQQN